jgi:hypothetical protein
MAPTVLRASVRAATRANSFVATALAHIDREGLQERIETGADFALVNASERRTLSSVSEVTDGWWCSSSSTSVRCVRNVSACSTDGQQEYADLQELREAL